ncbi:MAG: hypothetical protein O2807_00985 [bacterium]|nr:hypothetical protein [bacterium]
MAELVAAFAASHTPLLYTRAGEPSPEVQEDTFSAFRRMGQVIRERGAEALVVFGNDHLHALFMDRHPALAIGIRSRFKRVASEPYLPQLEGGYPGDDRLGFHLARSLLAGHFDPALCQDIDLDHSVIIPMHLMGDPDIPLVPILQNTVAPPLSPAARAFELGVAVRRAVERYDGAGRVAVLGTGALSHWIGTPGMGVIDQRWDMEVIDLLRAAAADQLSAWPQEKIDAGGNGANEIRNWIAAAAAAGNTAAALWSYQPEPSWFVGVTVLEWPIGPAIS